MASLKYGLLFYFLKHFFCQLSIKNILPILHHVLKQQLRTFLKNIKLPNYYL